MKKSFFMNKKNITIIICSLLLLLLCLFCIQTESVAFAIGETDSIAQGNR